MNAAARLSAASLLRAAIFGPAVPAPLASEDPGLRRRRDRCLTTSLVIHALLLGWLILVPHPKAAPPGLVEIGWLEPEPAPVAPAPPPSAPAPRPPAERPVVAAAAERPAVMFRREADRAEVAPQPQVTARQDRLNERLASLRDSESRAPALAAAAEPPSRWNRVALAGAPGSVGMTPSAPQSLARAAGPKGEALSLRREPTRGRAPALAPAEPAAAPSRAAAPAPGQEATASRTLAGVTLAGPIADRPVLAHPMPAYPDWATREAVEATVTLWFAVLPDGRIKENVQLQKTAGYSDFDDNATAALLGWRFAALPAGATEEQWGTITFRYRLRDTRRTP